MSGNYKNLYKNLQTRGILYSLGLHLLAVTVYFAATWTPEYQSIDFDMSNNSIGFSLSRKKSQKKMSITDLEKPDQSQNEPDERFSTADSNDGDDTPSELDAAEDLSFHSDAVAPRPVTRLKKIYPEKARLQEVEAVAYLSIVISSNGRILAVNVSGIKLKKNISPDIDAQLKKEFAIAAREILKDVKFSPAKIKGKAVPVIMDLPLNFTLN